ncbi:MAG: protein kinase [Polyangiaceae bacterium]
MVMRSPLAEARNESAAPRAGELVAGRYEVEGVIGSGGMGRVVAARDEKGRAVAIKLLLSPPSERVWVERFFREARAVSRINSAHVVKVLAVSSPNEATPFIVMERLRGRDFGKRLRAEGPLTLRDVADCIIQACDALANSHAVGVVHRDVKPSNLFDHVVDGVHTIKVLDFGISKARGQEEFEHTLTTSRDGMLGSPPYMSPEHIRDARSVDHRTDIWSLGVVAYQLLAGRLPFDGQSVGEVFCSVLERRFSPLASVRPDLPREIQAIIDKCLQRDPGDRYQTAADLARAFIPYATPSITTLVDAMPTLVPAASSGPSLVRAIPGAGVPLDEDVHTLTLPPIGPSVGQQLHAMTDALLVTNPTVLGSAPPRGVVELSTTLQPISEPLSAASVEAAKRMKRASRRTTMLVVGAAVALFALLSVPFLVRGTPSASTRDDVPIQPATAMTVTTPAPGTPTAQTGTGTVAPPNGTTAVDNAAAIAGAANAGTKPGSASPTAAATEDVTFTVSDHRAGARKTGTRSSKTTNTVKPAITHTAPPAAEPPVAPPVAPAPPTPAPRPEIHPNPY